MFAFPKTMIRTASVPGQLRAALVRGGLLLSSLLLAAPVFAQGGRLDQVFVRDSKGSLRQLTGTVAESGLEKLVLDRDGKEASFDNDRVERIIWGQVSASFREAQTYFDRGDFENAAAKFNLAADEDERSVIQAVARLSSGEALMALGKSDPTKFDAALSEFDSYISSYSSSRDLPRARAMQARATLLRGGAGDAKRAGELYRSLFEEGNTDTPTVGYDSYECLLAGLESARALITAGETLPARETLGALTSAARAMLASAPEDSPERVKLEALVAEAQLGEGFVLLASGQARQAETFFQAQLQNAKDGPAAQRFGALLGLGEAALAQGAEDSKKLREASLHLAGVAGLDFTNRDRTARALLLLAETLPKLGDSDGTAQARLRLQTLIQQYGDTPSAAAARALLESL
jgi:TolA-binding protein